MAHNNIDKSNLPLKGIRVLDMGQLIAGPFAATLLGDFGAEVIKVELPGIGDNARDVGPRYKNVPLWWKVEGRNKKSITLDVRKESGQKILKRLVEISDVLIENYLPGTLEKWNLSPDELKSVNPDLVLIRVSAYGQTGPYSKRYGYDRIALAYSGILYFSGYPGETPVKPGIAWVDYTTGIFSAFAAMIALYSRDTKKGGTGQVADIALYECMFRIIEYCVPQYHFLGEIRERTGNRHPCTAPGNTYITKDNECIITACSNDRTFNRLAKVMGKEHLSGDPRFKDANTRIKNADEIEKIVQDWISQFTLKDLLKKLNEGGVPASKIFSIKDVFNDPHIQVRENILDVDDKFLGKVKMQGVVPKLSGTPGRVKSTGPELGEHNSEIYKDLLKLNQAEINLLRKGNVI